VAKARKRESSSLQQFFPRMIFPAPIVEALIDSKSRILDQAGQALFR
jgi:hypothetical protein